MRDLAGLWAPAAGRHRARLRLVRKSRTAAGRGGRRQRGSWVSPDPEGRHSIRGDRWRAHVVRRERRVGYGRLRPPEGSVVRGSSTGTSCKLHSKEYRNPSQVQNGGVLVVGAGNSGAEIAIELARDHQTWLSGRDTGQEPTRAGSFPDHLATPILWFMATRVLKVNNPLGRKARDYFLDPPRGIPLGRIRRKDFAAAGIERVPRMSGVRNGSPVLEDGRVLDVSNVVWCTGFSPNYDWVDLPLPTRYGAPVHTRGVVESCAGLYLVGLPFLYSLSSPLVGRVGRDAEYIVEHIERLARKARGRPIDAGPGGARFTPAR